MKNFIVLFLVATTSLAAADGGPPPRSAVVHVPPIATVPGAPIELEAMIDAPFAEKLSVRWRALGDGTWQDATFSRSSAGGWFASLPAADVRGVEYYIRGIDGAGSEVAHFASETAPHVVRVDPTLVDRLEELDLQRLDGRRNEVAVEVTGHNFGNRYDKKDRFLRSEIVYSYKLLRQLHEIAFGFGTIAGNTPATEMEDASSLRKEINYGFGQFRLRPHPSFFIDARFGLGVSHEDFAAHGRTVLTFGKPWRSCVQVGGEYMDDLGASGWVRLQWDTAPPLLMGASVVRTDLPGVAIDVAGLYIAYDVQYRVANQFAIRGQISYGARDGAANVGGGLGTALAF